MKKCPFCAEEIKSDAIKCKHCGQMLSDHLSKNIKPSDNVKVDAKRSNKGSWVVVVLAFISTFQSLFEAEYTLAVASFIWVICFFPPLYEMIEKRFDRRVLTSQKIVTALGLGFLIAVISATISAFTS